ncbi:MAG: GLPGLI family protein [Paramuribaculum sp.]|nr:GLPGLI family protein [Paramuribaculum sp.]
MTATRLLTVLVLLTIAFGAAARDIQDHPRAEIKVSYNYHHKFLRGSDGVVEKNTPFILLANRNQSKFYCPSTEFKDSLESTPSGRAKSKQMFSAAAAAYAQTRDRSAMDAVVYHSRLYVLKIFDKSVSTTYDQAGMGECGYYDEPFSETEWNIVEDSTKTILDYQCVMATTDYHGRNWTVWFSPEIPMQDGPWKFCSLPGLILEATEPSGQHSFSATGIETSSQTIFPVFNTEYEKMNRIDMLRTERHYKENSNAMFKAATGHELGSGVDAPVTEESRKYDYLETDYH